MPRWPLLVVVLSACITPAPPPLTSDGPTRFLPRSATDSAAQPIDFRLKPYPDGAPFQLSSVRGSVVLVDVWATWCEPCRDALPLYQDLLKQFGPRGFKVYAVNVDADPREIEKFLGEVKLSLPILLDPEARLSETELHVRMMPTTLLLDRRGVVRSVEEGFREDVLAHYLKAIDSLLQENP